MIKCCYGCVAPKRHPACWDTCPEYQAEKAADDAVKAEKRKQEAVRYALDCQRIKAIKKIKQEGRRNG